MSNRVFVDMTDYGRCGVWHDHLHDKRFEAHGFLSVIFINLLGLLSSLLILCQKFYE